MAGTRRKRLKMSKGRLRSLSTSLGGLDSSFTDGNLIRTTAKVGDIRRHVNYASTADTPYFISSYSRYSFLKRERKSAVEDMSAFGGENAKEILNGLSDIIRESEDVKIQEFLKALGIREPSDFFIQKLNNPNFTGEGTHKSVYDLVKQTVDPMLNTYYRFMDKEYSPILAKEVEKLLKGEKANFDFADRKDLNLRKEKYTVDEFFNSVQNLIKIMKSPEIKMSDLQTVSQATTYAMTAAANARSYKGTLSEDRFGSLVRELEKTKASLEKQIITSGSTELKYMENWYGQGFVSEVITGYAMMGAIASIKNNSPIKEEQFLDNSYRKIEGLAFEIMSGSADTKNKTIDGRFVYENDSGVLASLTVDIKQPGYATAEKSGLSYTTSGNIDFNEAYHKLINNNKIPESVRRFYRATVFNIAVNDGYSPTPKERAMLIQEFYSDKENYDKKFNAVDGYPCLVTIQGKTMRFSDAIRQMADIENIESDSIGKMSSSQRISSPEELYQRKIKVGRGNTSTPRRLPGFVNYFPDLVELARNTEDMYFGRTKRRVKFKLRLGGN